MNINFNKRQYRLIKHILAPFQKRAKYRQTSTRTTLLRLTATRHASLSACFGHNGTPLLPRFANKSAQRVTAWRLTDIVEPALNKTEGNFC